MPQKINKMPKFGMIFAREIFPVSYAYALDQVSAAALDSGNIRFVRLFPGVPWKRVVKRQWGNQKRRFRTLCLRHLRKWGQHYYI